MMTLKTFDTISRSVPAEDLCGMLDTETLSSLRASTFEGRTYVDKFTERCSVATKNFVERQNRFFQRFEQRFPNTFSTEPKASLRRRIAASTDNWEKYSLIRDFFRLSSSHETAQLICTASSADNTPLLPCLLSIYFSQVRDSPSWRSPKDLKATLRKSLVNAIGVDNPHTISLLISTEKIPQNDIYNCFWDAVKKDKTASAKTIIDLGSLSSRSIQKAFVRSLERNNVDLAQHILRKHEICGHRLEEGLELAITREYVAVFKSLIEKFQVPENYMERMISLVKAQKNEAIKKVLGYDD